MKGRLVSKPWRCAVARTGLAVSRWYSKPAARTEAGISGRPATSVVGRICSWRVAQLPYRTSNYALLPPPRDARRLVLHARGLSHLSLANSWHHWPQTLRPAPGARHLVARCSLAHFQLASYPYSFPENN